MGWLPTLPAKEPSHLAGTPSGPRSGHDRRAPGTAKSGPTVRTLPVGSSLATTGGTSGELRPAATGSSCWSDPDPCRRGGVVGITDRQRPIWSAASRSGPCPWRGGDLRDDGRLPESLAAGSVSTGSRPKRREIVSGASLPGVGLRAGLRGGVLPPARLWRQPQG